MKHTRRIASLLLALVMVFAMATTAFATGETGSITVDNFAIGQTYTIYQIFDLESYADSTPNIEGDGAYSYKVASAWAGFFAAATDTSDAGKGLDYVDIDANGYVTWKTGASASNFAADAISFAETNSIGNQGAVTTNSTTTEVKFNNLDLGYYLVDSSLGALCALDTTNPNATVIEKNAGHNLDKDVKEDSTGNWGDSNDASIGEEVEFKATITISGVAKNLVMHDTMDDGLTYGSVTSVTLNNNPVATTSYSVTTNVTHTDNKGTEETEDDTTETHTFDVTFTDDFCASLKTGDTIVVYYKATVNENAVVKVAELNKSNLTYKDNNNVTHETQDSQTQTFTWEIDVLKYANGNEANVLAGAKFKLYTDKACTSVVKYTEIKENGKTTIYEVSANGTVEEITTDSTGKFEIHGLDSGIYYLKETAAPNGYNQLNTVVEVKIDTDGKVYVGTEGTDSAATTYTELADGTVKVNNNSGSELPSTGGMGTTLFYVVGGLMVLAAVVLLVTKKRMAAAE